ncbi:MAG: hypothetical protein ACI8P3_001373 [Saprospiraceae bacterium]|jgi:hypothetical protein
MSQIFISYRREDSPEAAGRIYDRLKSHFGEKQVFFDIDSIPPGIDFRQFISESVSKCDVLLVIIGDRWLAKDNNGVSRLEDPSDFVRIEIEAALKRRIPVIPVPVGRAKEPSKEELPSNIKDLHYRNSCEVRSGTSFEGHIQRLIYGIENSTGAVLNTDKLKQINGKKERQDGKRRLVGWKVLLGIVLISVAFFVFWILSQSDRTTAEFTGDVSTEAQEVVSLKELYVLSSLGSSSVAPGEKATISVTVKDKDGRAIEDATVLISSGGGKFLESKNMSYDPASKLQGPFKVSGKTESSGVFTSWWACYPCAGGYEMSVIVSKSGYEDKRSKLTVNISR